MIGVGLTEPIEVAKRPAAPGKDRLVIVPDDREVAVRLCQQAQQLELRVVRVLELIDEDVVEARPQARGRGGMLAQQAECERDLVAEVHDAMPLLDPRVRLVGRGELLMHRGLVGLDVRVDRLSDRRAERACVSDVCLRRNVFVARATEELEEGTHVSQRIPRWPVALERHRDLALLTAVQMLTHEDHLLRRREDAKLAGPAKLESELAEDLVAEAMEGADDGVVQTDRRVDVDALRISLAARSVNVTARISFGFAARDVMRWTIRAVRTWVFPVPAPATTSSAPAPCSTARRCSSVSDPRMFGRSSPSPKVSCSVTDRSYVL